MIEGACVTVVTDVEAVVTNCVTVDAAKGLAKMAIAPCLGARLQEAIVRSSPGVKQTQRGLMAYLEASVSWSLCL